jgi:hypothetical protein
VGDRVQLLLIGLAEFDVDMWEKHAIYRTYTKKSKQIVWFWEVRAAFIIFGYCCR